MRTLPLIVALCACCPTSTSAPSKLASATARTEVKKRFRGATVRADDGKATVQIPHEGRTVVARDSPPTITSYHSASGRVEWTATLPPGPETSVSIEALGVDADGRAMVVRDGSTTLVQTFDRSGALVWTVTQPYWIHDAVVFSDHIALVSNELIVMLRSSTGVEHAQTRLPETHGYATVVRNATSLVVASPTHHNTGMVGTYRVPDGAPLWTASLPFDHHGALLVSRGVVMAESQGSVLHVLDAATGAPRWQRSIGSPFELSMVDGHPVVTPESGDRMVVERRPTNPLRGAITVEGVISQVYCGDIAGVEVAVDDVRVTTTAAGKYRAVLHANGIVRVNVPGGLTDEQRIPIKGARHYKVPPMTADFCNYD